MTVEDDPAFDPPNYRVAQVSVRLALQLRASERARNTEENFRAVVKHPQRPDFFVRTRDTQWVAFEAKKSKDTNY